MEENNDEYYKQILYSNEYFNYDKDLIIKINLTNQFYLFLFCILILTSQTNALPIHRVNSNQLGSVSNIQQFSTTTTIKLRDFSMPSNHLQFNNYKIYRHIPISSYSNNGIVQVYNQRNFNNQQQERQLRRERYRRIMIDKIFFIFDEDANGQLTKDELYSLSLRLNIFPKFHHFLKKNSS
ncbi:unnamed protein product [Rotaria sp. Silwood1]|nr:unnamed protein product [Rotaria sp. Silwood1]CAF1594931.1 unnamed protein product [Rotaria sp. Silwood1]CAF1595584.1 unnamed protein product [Rotaria sp. Silwood1]CAF3673426.1 unnamed protein product [Rotaria sp. Silwood1]CAF3702223.1 unnamed protein product [Rotaria sp. Silwood1]